MGASSPQSVEGLPTLRLPVRQASGVAPPGSHDPLTTTPPPQDDLRLSASAWGGDGEDAFSSGRRAPRVGDTVLGFRLVGELGRGAFARVFLAHQEALADRQVALKVTLRPTREAERLARLQHTNVVPVYSVHDDAPVQLICMPFLGRTTLADLIRAYRIDHPSRPAGRKSTAARGPRTTALDSRGRSGSKSAADSKGSSGPARVATWTWAAEEQPPIVGDPRAVLELLVQLAAGLTHAHDRGILHLDIKPANVLLADTGEPMFLDFNLSYDAARPDRELVGGTMPYMAIEQLLDMRARGKGAGTIDRRTDLYSLGVLAFEMLTGTVPFRASSRDLDAQLAARRQGPPALRKLNPDVTPAVEAIVRKLLAADPADRYQSAEELRIDAERHLNDLPLKYAREGPSRERFAKWRRRNPGIPVRIAAACLIGLALGLGGAVQRRAEATARYEAVERAQSARAALDTTRLDLVLPNDPKARARGMNRATEVLAAYGLPGDADWRDRAVVQRLTETERAALADDLAELMILTAQAKWQEVGTRPESERRELTAEAWRLNVAARACFGSVPPLADRQAAVLAPAAGETFEAPAPAKAAPGPRSLFLDAADALNRGRYATAADLLDRVIATQPDHAAAQFCLAFCRQQTGQHQRALERYDAAQVLLPDDPRPAYQRGLIRALTRKHSEAEAEFTKALAFDPDHPDAYRNRALARLRLGLKAREKGRKDADVKLAEAEADLDGALARGAPPRHVHFLRGVVRDVRGNKSGAAADRDVNKGAALKTEADYLVRGWTVLDTDPKAALADFCKAAEINPRSLIALQNQAHVLADKLKNNEAALAVVSIAAELYPEFAPAVAGRAVVLARLGRREEAHTEIEKARQFSDDAEIIYQAASVYAVTSVKNPGDKALAIQFLREAFQRGYTDLDGLKKDPDLDPLRGDAEFQKICQGAEAIFRSR